MSALREVLAAHEWTWRVFQQRPIMVCGCGDELIPATSSGVAGLADHRAHVEAVVLAWIGERLADEGLRDAVARAIERAAWSSMIARHDGLPGVSRADAALAAVRAGLGVER